MLIKDGKHFTKGLLLAITFFIVLVAMFLPLFEGGINFLQKSDQIFNSISKGSTHYIADLEKKNQEFAGKTFKVDVKIKNAEVGQRIAKIFTTAGATVTGEGTQLQISGDLGLVLKSTLKDSDAMFFNKDSELKTKYGFSGLDSMYAWWSGLKEMDKDLKRQAKFKEADFINTVLKKAVEVSYNYFTVIPESAVSSAGILAFLLVFYVVYTLWWGFAVFFLFEGIGLQMTASAKKEH
ncbi:MAG: hypothetical protein V1897_08820 [Pseudomonadota bacterium]